jgi:putative nucleotidyltransferase with HDIG domain
MHCRRVASVGQALAHQLFLSTEPKSLLYSASLLHHADLGPLALSGDIRDLLWCFERPGAGSEEHRLLADIMRIADAYDSAYESAAWGEDAADLREGAAGGLWPSKLVDALERLPSTAELGEPVDWRLPSFAAAAARILGLMSRATVSVGDLEEAARTDPGIACKLIQLANSALFGSRIPVATLGTAVTRLGFQTSRKVIASSLVGPLLAAPRMRSLWLHSLEVADLAEQIAEHMGSVDGGEAYLCGLLHDAGNLVLSRLPLFDVARLRGLEHGGCPPVYAENLILDRDHAELGAKLTEYWKLPAHMTEAIRHHHRPERSRSQHAHLLYVADFLSCRDEDLPSHRRLTIALDGIGMRLEEVVRMKATAVSEWLAAA